MTENLYARRQSKVRSEEGDTKVEYSEEQLLAVQKIRKCKDYYDILGVSKDAGDSDLRKQYKKLALQFHPDKNKTPGAVEAFKAIGNAFAVLSDAEKRKQYDMYGAEGAQRMHGHATANGEYNDYSAFQGDISPEDLFNMFFGGGFSSGGTTFVRRGNQWQRFGPRANNTHHHHHYYNRQQQEDSRGVLLQILPLVILISISFLSNLFTTEPIYSLSRTSKYIIERKTPQLKIPYFVKEDFDKTNKGKIPSIEREVEEDYLMSMRSACHRERNYREATIWRAKTFKDHALIEKAERLRTPSCEALNEIYTNMERVY